MESHAARAAYTHALEKRERVNKACPHGKDLQDVRGTTTPRPPVVVALCAWPWPLLKVKVRVARVTPRNWALQ